MNSLLEKEGMAGQVQMVYIDPPYGIKYGSNFQPFVNKRDVKDGKDEDLTAEPEQIRAFRDTWELGIHSYLAYLRDRLLLAKELLHESGSCFVQISDENVHHVRELMDEVFGAGNFVSLISFKKTVYQETSYIANVFDLLLWYGKSREQTKVRKLFRFREEGELRRSFDLIEMPDRSIERAAPTQDVPQGAQLLRASDLTSKGASERGSLPFMFKNVEYRPKAGNHWKTHSEGLANLSKANRLVAFGKTLCFKKYAADIPVTPFFNVWDDTVQSTFATENIYVVQTYTKVIERCLLMTTDPGDLVFDPTCGSGTTAYVAEQWGRRWITCDTSRVALTLAKQRLMTPLFDYYELAHPSEGVGSGFKYRTVPHVTLKSIANNEPPGEETLYDQPNVDTSRARVAGPFTVEAVPAQAVKPLDSVPTPAVGGESQLDTSIARSGETLRQSEWRDELLKTGIRGKAGQHINFSRVEPMGGTRWLHADAETKGDKPERVVVSFGPEHAPLERRQVELALQEAQRLKPDPKIVLFAAFQFDPEAAKDIDETDWPGVTLLKAQMNADMLTDDLKKKRSSNESFWLIGQPDVKLEQIAEGEDKGKYKVEVLGWDYYNTRTGNIDSGGTENIAMWMLDPNYDGRSVFPRQVFFPMADEKEGWSRLAKNLKAEIDEELIEAYRGTVSLPFEPGDNRRIAVKIIDDRGIESLKIIETDWRSERA